MSKEKFSFCRDSFHFLRYVVFKYTADLNNRTNMNNTVSFEKIIRKQNLPTSNVIDIFCYKYVEHKSITKSVFKYNKNLTRAWLLIAFTVWNRLSTNIRKPRFYYRLIRYTPNLQYVVGSILILIYINISNVSKRTRACLVSRKSENSFRFLSLKPNSRVLCIIISFRVII